MNQIFNNGIMNKICSFLLVSIFAIQAAAQPIDRSRPPVPGPAPVLNVLEADSFTLANGIKVLVVENHKAPKVQVSYTIDRTPFPEGKKAGLFEILGAMLKEGTVKKSKSEFDEETDLIGATVTIDANGGHTSALTKYFENAVELFAEALMYPSFQLEALEKNRAQLIQLLKANEKNTSAISGRVVNALNFGIAHPYGEFATEATYANITLEDVKNAYKKYFTPDRGYLVFVGDINAERARQLAQKYFGGWKGSKLTRLSPTVPATRKKSEINVVDVPNAVQTEITITHPISYRKNSPDYFALLVANEILGGGAQSRLFKNLREAHGFTYGAYSSVQHDRFGCGSFSATASVRNEVADSAVQELIRELQNIRQGKISAEDLKDVKNSLSGKFALSLEDPARVGQFALDIAIEKLPPDFYRNYLKRINAVTVEDIQNAARKYFQVDKARIIMTGKADDFRSSLARLGITVIDFDKYAKPVVVPGRH
jgi:predicted Zn-dependent peptidase